MAMKIWAKIDGMPGSATESGRDDWCELRGFSHEMVYPFDMQDMSGTSEPKHGAVTLWKAIDKSSPKIYEALAKKSQVASVEIEFERDNPNDGKTEVYYTMKLEDCRVIYARPHVPNSQEITDQSLPHMDQVGFAYRKINWTWKSGGQVPTTFDFNDPNS